MHDTTYRGVDRTCERVRGVVTGLSEGVCDGVATGLRQGGKPPRDLEGPTLTRRVYTINCFGITPALPHRQQGDAGGATRQVVPSERRGVSALDGSRAPHRRAALVGARVRVGARQIATGVCDGVATGWKTLTRFRGPRFGPARVPRHAKSRLTLALLTSGRVMREGSTRQVVPSERRGGCVFGRSHVPS